MALHQLFRIAKFRCDSIGYRPSPYCSLGARITTLRCHTNRSVKLPSFGHFQDRSLTTLTLLFSLLSSISLLVLFSDSPCFFSVFFLPFPRILGVPQSEKPLLFLGGKPLLFPKKTRVGGSGHQQGRSAEQKTGHCQGFSNVPWRKRAFGPVSECQMPL